MSDIESSNRRRPGPVVRLPHLLLIWLAYTSLVVYGSLVPLTFHPLPLEAAWATFGKLPMYQLGVEQRADWVANGVLFVPIGFLTGTLFAANGSLIRRLPSLFLSALFCVVLALALEFTQLFFPPRTVSRNDVMAELIGSGIGIIFAVYWSEWFRRMVAALAGKMGELNSRLLQAYAIGYLAFSFFPFDLVVSMTELAAKVNSDTWGWFLAGQSTNRGPVILLAKLLAEVLAVVPIGLLVGSRNARMGQACTRHALTYGMLLGLLIEVAQLFIFSGVTQGISVLARTLGMYCGAHLWKERGRLSGLPLHPAKSCWSVPLTLFTHNDQQFLELFCREVAIALNTLELLVAEKMSTATESSDLILKEMAQPIDEVLNDTAWILERYIGHDPAVCERLQRILKHTRSVRQLVHRVGESLAPTVNNPPVTLRPQRPKLKQKRVLVVDNDETVRIAAHELLGRFGCEVETAHHGEEALLMVRTFHYDAVIADIRLPDMTGYDCFVKIREINAHLPVILMTGFGYDPSHSIVKARQMGLKSVLYKPFRLDQLLKELETAVSSPAESQG